MKSKPYTAAQSPHHNNPIDRVLAFFSKTKASKEHCEQLPEVNRKRKSHSQPLEHLQRLIATRQFSLASFDVVATVGTGSFAKVKLARLKPFTGPDDSSFALKILEKHKLIKELQVYNAKAEQEILCSIDHPFIVQFFHSFQDAWRIFMVLEYVNGGELWSYIERQGGLSGDTAKFYTAEIILALEYMHSQSIVYRDLKPENLLVDGEGHIKIVDFGLAKVVEDRTFTVCGTEEYLSPEMLKGQGYGKSVDWWALGALVFEMIAGKCAFEGDTTAELQKNILHAQVEFHPAFDSKASSLIKLLLVKDPTRRYGCMKSGAEDVKKHKWFKGIKWDMVLARRLTVPFVPNMQSESGALMFTAHPASGNGSVPPLITPQQQEYYFNGFCPDISDDTAKGIDPIQPDRCVVDSNVCGA